MSTIFQKSAYFIVILLLISTSCEDKIKIERTLLISELSDLEQQKSLLVAQINSLSKKYTLAQQESYTLKNDIARYQREVNAYLMNHKMATAAIVGGMGGTSVALEDGNTFSQEAKNIGAGIAILSAFYAIDNAGEVIEVADKLNQADVNIKEAKNYLGKLTEDVIWHKNAIAQKTSALSTINDSVIAKRTRLRKLKK